MGRKSGGNNIWLNGQVQLNYKNQTPVRMHDAQLMFGGYDYSGLLEPRKELVE